jgi:hypothetical protein
MLDRTVGINPEWRRRLPTTSLHGSSRVTGVLLDSGRIVFQMYDTVPNRESGP